MASKIMQNSFDVKKIYSDFDGTITKIDTVHMLVKAFASEGWVEAEKLWCEGKMTSRDCIVHQLKLINNISESRLNNFIDSIEIDPYFPRFYNYLKENNIELVILSDGFDLFIKKTLEKNNLHGIKFFTNKLIHKNNKLFVEFPNLNPDCKFGSGSCKCSKIKEKNFCYIGDGRSDICVSRKASVLFAKKTLLDYCKDKKIEHIPYNSFQDILNIFERRQRKHEQPCKIH